MQDQIMCYGNIMRKFTNHLHGHMVLLITNVTFCGFLRKFRDEFIMCAHPTMEVMQGVGVSCFNPKQKQYPLINGIDAARDSENKENAR